MGRQVEQWVWYLHAVTTLAGHEVQAVSSYAFPYCGLLPRLAVPQRGSSPRTMRWLSRQLIPSA